MFLSRWGLNARPHGLGVEQSAVMADVTCLHRLSPPDPSCQSVIWVSGEGSLLHVRNAPSDQRISNAHAQTLRSHVTLPPSRHHSPRSSLISTCLQYSALKLIGTLTSPSAASYSTSLASRTRVTSLSMEASIRVFPKVFKGITSQLYIYILSYSLHIGNNRIGKALGLYCTSGDDSGSNP